MNVGGAYLLAAGRGKRAGGPKAWILSDGKSLLERQISFLFRLFKPEEITVAIQKEWLGRCRSIDPRVAWVPVDPDAPMLASFQALLKAAPPKSWFSLHHVDMPVWSETLFRVLFERVSNAAAEAVVPVFEKHGGHPVLLSPELAGPLGKLDPAKDRLDQWLHTRKLKRTPVPFRCVLENRNS